MTLPIANYLNVRLAYWPSFSSDGSSLAFIWNVTGVPQVWQVDLQRAQQGPPWPRQLSFAGDRVLAIRYSPAANDPRLMYAYDVGGSENAQLFVLDTETGAETALTAGHEDAMHIPGEWSDDGRFLLFAANRRHPAQFDLYRQPTAGGEAEMLWQHEEPGYLMSATFAPGEQRVAVVRMAKSAEHEVLEIELAGGRVRQLNPQDSPAVFTGIAYSKDGRYLYANTDLDSEFLHVARLDLATGRWEKLVAPNWDTELLARSPNGRYLAYAVNQHGDSQLELIDLATGTARPAPLLDPTPGVVGQFDQLLAFSADSSRLAFSYTSATRTSDIYVWHLDLQEDRVERVTDAGHGGIPEGAFAQPRLIRYATFDDREIPAWYYLPERRPEGEKLPVVVIVHGGPESQYRPYFNFLAHYLVHNGYAVLAPNVRGSTGYGKTYKHLDDVEKRMDSVADLAHAVYWLRQQPEVDGQRVAVYGGSYGGFMVLSSLTNYPGLWAAGVDIVGISNFVTFLENTSDYRRGHRESEYGSLAHHRDFLESVSPLNQLDRIEAPLMVIHGENDPRVPVSEARQLVAALEERDVPVELLVFDDEGHGLAKLHNKLVAYPAVIRFLDRVLK